MRNRLLLAFLILFNIFAAYAESGSLHGKQIKCKFIGASRLNTYIKYDNDEFIVCNNDVFDYRSLVFMVGIKEDSCGGCTLEYEYRINVIPAGKTVAIPARNFKKKDGTVLNPKIFKPKTIDLKGKIGESDLECREYMEFIHYADGELTPDTHPERFLKRGQFIEINQNEVRLEPLPGTKCEKLGQPMIRVTTKLKPGDCIRVLLKQECEDEVWYRCHLENIGVGWVNSIVLRGNYKSIGEDPMHY